MGFVFSTLKFSDFTMYMLCVYIRTTFAVLDTFHTLRLASSRMMVINIYSNICARTFAMQSFYVKLLPEKNLLHLENSDQLTKWSYFIGCVDIAFLVSLQDSKRKTFGKLKQLFTYF
jgi:hypothetical protein